MAASAGAWYRVGKVNVTNDNQSVVGVDTNWQSDVIAIAIGDIFTLDAKTWYEVIAVNSDTSITLDRGFEGSTSTNKTYAIVRNTSGTILTRIAGQVSVQFNQKQLFLDELRTWLNSDNATEELTDSHGLKQSLKTPSQMVRDHDEKLAELDTIHPYPWAMRKVEFEARRAANNEKFAASGFVHFGKHRNSTEGLEAPVEEGLYYRTDTPNTLRLGRVGGSNTEGVSKTGEAVINVAGVISNLKYLSSPTATSAIGCEVQFPPAEDGTRTYDSATGLSVTHATAAIAFASETDTNKVVTDRVDMWGFEAFLREINDADPFVYANGLIQSLATSINGVATVSDNVRPITYFAWYEGDEDSRGKGVNWQTASEAQRMVIASDPENNIYFDDSTGKFYQPSVRGRSFAGSGNGAWAFIDAPSAKNGIPLTYDGVDLVSPQGLEDSASNLRANGRYHSNKFFNTIPDISGIDEALFMATKPVAPYTSPQTNKAVNGECYFLVCGTVNRLNRGGYHPSFNPLGAAAFIADTSGSPRYWYHNNVKTSELVNTKDACFNYGTEKGNVAAHTGAISSADAGEYYSTGRPDRRYYDAIYASGQGGVCRDMRYSAWGLTQENFSESDLKVKSGKYRGQEQFPTMRTFLSNVTPSSTTSVLKLPTAEILGFVDYPSSDLADKTITGHLVDTTGRVYAIETAYLVLSQQELWVKLEGVDLAPTDGAPWSGVLGSVLQGSCTVSGATSIVDVIGTPANIMLCEDLKDGWLGRWLPKTQGPTQNGTGSKIPSSGFDFSRPSGFPSTPQVIQTVNNGDTWETLTHRAEGLSGISDIRGVVSNFGEGNFSYSPSKNLLAITDAVGASTGVTVISYTAKTKVTKPTANSKVKGGELGLGHVFMSMVTSESQGSLLDYSLTNNLSKHINTAGRKGWDTRSLTAVAMDKEDGQLLENKLSNEVTQHSSIELGAPTNDSPAFKTLNYNVVENQQGFINYAYTELTYDVTAGDWGDDGKIHIADNQTTMLDTNGNTVKVGTARIVEPLGWIKNDK